jgi:hypothetical protein
MLLGSQGAGWLEVGVAIAAEVTGALEQPGRGARGLVLKAGAITLNSGACSGPVGGGFLRLPGAGGNLTGGTLFGNPEACTTPALRYYAACNLSSGLRERSGGVVRRPIVPILILCQASRDPDGRSPAQVSVRRWWAVSSRFEDTERDPGGSRGC